MLRSLCRPSRRRIHLVVTRDVLAFVFHLNALGQIIGTGLNPRLKAWVEGRQGGLPCLEDVPPAGSGSWSEVDASLSSLTGQVLPTGPISVRDTVDRVPSHKSFSSVNRTTRCRTRSTPSSLAFPSAYVFVHTGEDRHTRVRRVPLAAS